MLAIYVCLQVNRFKHHVCSSGLLRRPVARRALKMSSHQLPAAESPSAQPSSSSGSAIQTQEWQAQSSRDRQASSALGNHTAYGFAASAAQTAANASHVLQTASHTLKQHSSQVLLYKSLVQLLARSQEPHAYTGHHCNNLSFESAEAQALPSRMAVCNQKSFEQLQQACMPLCSGSDSFADLLSCHGSQPVSSCRRIAFAIGCARQPFLLDQYLRLQGSSTGLTPLPISAVALGQAPARSDAIPTGSDILLDALREEEVAAHAQQFLDTEQGQAVLQQRGLKGLEEQ